MSSQKRAAHNPDGVVRTYIKRVSAFSPNARIYLISIMIYGAGLGIHRFLFNFFLRSLGYDETFMGLISTISSMTVLISALPMGYLADRLGRKFSMVLAVLVTGAAVFLMVIFHTPIILVFTNILMGIGSSLGAVVSGPFMMENSGEEERTYLFSMDSGLRMAANSVGDWLGGYLPSWFGKAFQVSAISATAYAWSVGVAGVLVLATAIPRLMLKRNQLGTKNRAAFAPIAFARQNPGTLPKLLLPMFITSIGDGLIMPFMNIFFSNVHQQPDRVIGALMAWGSLAMGVGLILAPVFADRFGKIRVVVYSQAISIPFLIMLGFSSSFGLSTVAYFVRLTLMNMSSPVYQTFVMEQVEADARAMVASLNSMVNSFGRAFSPVISGWAQVNYGFGPPFLGTIFTYIIAIWMYYAFFLRKKERAQ